MAEQSTIAFRYTGTFETRKKTYAALERLGDFASFEVPPEWLPDDIEVNDLVQVSTDKPGGIFEIAIVETPEDADNFDAPAETYED
jgi:hypothetical protein